MPDFKKLIIICSLAILTLACTTKKQTLPVIYIDKPSAQTSYAVNNAEKLYNVYKFSSAGLPQDANIIITTDPAGLKAEGYSIRNSNGKLFIQAADSIGAMYALLDIAEQLSFGLSLNQVEDKTISPALKNRFIKFNLPWSSYRRGKALSLHEETCRDTTFWRSFLDMMAKNRFNSLSLWNLHPFEDMIKPDKYPEASALTDSVLNERRKFYSSLFSMAKERGIQTYLVNWNIFVSEAFAKAHQLADYNKTGNFWGDADNSELIEDYTRECVKQLINDYPDLSGLGITLGERMGGMNATQRRDWINRTIIKGMSMADRKVKLLYRAPLSAGLTSHGTTSKLTEEITREVLDTLSIPSETIISFKYNWSHGHSSDKLFIVHGGELTDTYWNPIPENYSVLWTIRNEDFFTHRWAKPGFVRSFLKNNMHQYTSGCIIGSECYIPATDYFTRDMDNKPFTYAFERQWLWYSIWGRLLYNTQTKNELFVNQLNKKFNIDYGEKLLETWELASDYYHHFASFYKGTWDAAIYSEAFSALNQSKKFSEKQVSIITLDALGSHPVLDSLRYMNISDFILQKKADNDSLLTPVELSKLLKSNAQQVLSELHSFDKNISIALDMELKDLEALAYLQLFFAYRIDATLLLANKLLLGKDIDTKKLLKLVDESIAYWEKVTKLKETYNKKVIPYMFNAELDYNEYLNILKNERDHLNEIDAFTDISLK